MCLIPAQWLWVTCSDTRLLPKGSKTFSEKNWGLFEDIEDAGGSKSENLDSGWMFNDSVFFVITLFS